MTEPITPERETKGYKIIMNLYAAFGVSLILSVVPSVAAGVLSGVFFIGVLCAAYAFRKRAEEMSLLANHTTFIIRTLWIAAFLSLITSLIASVYMLGAIDYSPFDPCANTLANKGTAWLETASTTELYGIVQPCLDAFLSFNKTAMTNAVLIAGAPMVAYMAYRLAKGLMRAKDGYRLANVKSWF